MADIFSGIANTIGSIPDATTNIVSRVAQGALDAVQDTNIGRLGRMVGLLPGANPLSGNIASGAWDTGSNTDWRVKLSIPPSPEYQDSVLLGPLKETGGFVFPYTPTVFVQHTASYNSIAPTHSNYPFPVYSNSQVDSITIQGEFTVENSREAEYWIGAVHYLKSVTKMSYGESSTQGAPPPVVKLNGYGDYVFKNVPVVITNFNLNMESEVDYIEAPIGPNGSWAPVKSSIAVTLMPAYSRDKVNKFSMDAFVSGMYVIDDEAGYL